MSAQLSASATPLLAHLGWAAFTGGLFIALVALVVRAVPRLSPGFRSALWWLACLKLLVGLAWTAPVRLPVLPASLVDRLPAAIADLAVREGVGSTALAARGGLGGPPLQAPDPAIAAGGAVTMTHAGRTLSLSNPVRLVATDGLTPAAGAPAPSSSSSWTLGLVVLWLTGALLQLVALAWALLRGRRVIHRAAPVREAGLIALFTHLVARIGLRREPGLRLSADVETPQALGSLRPHILLPRKRLSALTPSEIEMTLCHELLHVRRGDLWFGWVPALAQRIFFFFPPAAWAAREYLIAREAACDAEVLRVLGSAPQAYGRLLLRWGVAPRETGLAAAGASPSLVNLKRRLQMLHESSEPARRAKLRWASLGVLALVAMIPFTVVAQPRDPEPANPADPATAATVADQAALPEPADAAEPAVPGDPSEAPEAAEPAEASEAGTPAPEPEWAETPEAVEPPEAPEAGEPAELMETPEPPPVPRVPRRAGFPTPAPAPRAYATPRPPRIPGVPVVAPRALTAPPVPRPVVAPAPAWAPRAVPTPASPAPPASPVPAPRPVATPPVLVERVIGGPYPAPPVPARAPRPVAAPPVIVARVVGGPYPAPPVPRAPGASYATPSTPVAPRAPLPSRTPLAPAIAGSQHTTRSYSQSSSGSHISYSNGDDESWVFISGNDTSMSGSNRDLDQARKARGGSSGEILWFKRDGKAYVVRDPAVLSRLKALWEPISELGDKQGALGDEQGKLGDKQGELGDQQGRLGDKMGELGSKMGEIGSRMGRADDREQERLDKESEGLQRQMDELSRQQEKLGDKQEALGRQQEVLGRQQEALGRQQEAASAKAEGELRHLIDESLRNGSAEPLNR